MRVVSQETWNLTPKPSSCEIKLNWFGEQWGVGKGLITDMLKDTKMENIRNKREIHEAT